MPASSEPVTARAGADSPRPAWVLGVVVVLMLLAVVAAPSGWGYIDTARDLYWALRIARAEEFPLAGPQIGFFVNLGPVWFYLMAVPLVVHASFTAAALWAALIASLKYPLALWLGTRLVDWRLGLTWALALALPGLATFSQVIMTHYGATGTAVMATLCACYLHHRRASAWTAGLLGLAFSLMLHAHPTTIAYGWLLPWVLWRRGPGRVSATLACALGGLLPFLPLLFLQIDTGGGDLKAVADYLLGGLLLDHVARWPALMWHSITVGSGAALGLVTQGAPYLRMPALLVLLALAGLALAGAVAVLRTGAHRRLWLAAVGGWCLWALQVAILREQTWWYMMLGGVPLLALAGAVSVRALAVRPAGGWLLPVLAAVVPLFPLLFVVSIYHAAAAGDRVHFPTTRLMNLKQSRTWTPGLPNPWLSHASSDRMGALLCRLEGSVVVHGALALQVDSMGGMATDFHCRRVSGLYVAGRLPEAEHRLGLGPAVLADLDVPVTDYLGPFGLFRPTRIIYPPEPEPAASAREYLPRDWVGPPDRELELSFTLPAGEYVTLNNPVLWWWKMHDVQVTLDGETVEPLAADSVTSVYGCRTCPATRRLSWTIRLKAADRYEPDVVTLDRDGRARTIPSPPDDLRVRNRLLPE